MTVLTVDTSSRCQLLNITQEVSKAVKESHINSGLCVVFVPHTTAGITINENADRDVSSDILAHLERVVPLECNYRHIEGNSSAHIKAALVGNSVTLIIERGELVLGRWQGIFFAEFDGPRRRSVYVQVIGTQS